MRGRRLHDGKVNATKAQVHRVCPLLCTASTEHDCATTVQASQPSRRIQGDDWAPIIGCDQYWRLVYTASAACLCTCPSLRSSSSSHLQVNRPVWCPCTAAFAVASPLTRKATQRSLHFMRASGAGKATVQASMSKKTPADAKLAGYYFPLTAAQRFNLSAPPKGDLRNGVYLPHVAALQFTGDYTMSKVRSSIAVRARACCLCLTISSVEHDAVQCSASLSKGQPAALRCFVMHSCKLLR